MSFDWSDYLMSDQESEFPPTFKFENKGDKVAGEVIEVREWKDGDKKTPILEIQDDERGRVSVFISQVLLRQKVAEKDPQVGHAIEITYVGSEKTKRGNTMKDFDVFVTKPDPDEAPF